MKPDRYVCTKEAPWAPGKGPAVHPDAEDVGECFDSCCDKYTCPHCDYTFYVEVTQ